MSWSQGGEGMAGSQEIAESDPPRRVVYALSFGPGTEAQATLDLEPAAGGTRVTWGFAYRTGYDIVGRYIGALVKNRVGDQYTEGLEQGRMGSCNQASTMHRCVIARPRLFP